MSIPGSRDSIVFEKMVLPCRVGVLPGESDQPQDVRVRLQVDYDASVAGTTDSMADAVDYRWVGTVVEGVLARGPYDLLESVAQGIAKALVGDRRILAAEVGVAKVTPPMGEAFGAIEVRVRRVRGETP